MASTASDLIKFEKQATGENASTWGDKANTAMSRLEEAIADITNITVTGAADYTLDDTQYTEHSDAGNTSESHCASIKATGALTANQAVIVPSRNKIYWVWNGTSGAFTVTVKTSAGAGIVVPSGGLQALICDGTNVEALSKAVDVDGALVEALPLLEGGTGSTTASGAFTNIKQAASATATGVVELATDAETATGTDTARAVTPANVSSHYSPIDRAINADTTTALTMALTDAGDVVTMNNASANTLTVPANATIAFDTGTQIDIVQLGAGVTTITGATGVTINGVSAGSGDLSSQYSAVTLIKLATDTWALVGGHGGVA